MADNNVITIKKLLDIGLNNHLNYKDQIVVSYVKDLDLLKYPCHLNAITILICISGEIDSHINLKKYTIGSSSMLINLPENIIKISDVKNLKAFSVMISSEYMRKLGLDIFSQNHRFLYELKQNENVVLPEDEIMNMRNYLNLFRHSLSPQHNNTNSELIQHLVSSFVVNALMLHNKYNVGQTPVHPHNSRSSHLIFDKFMELVRIYHTKEREITFYAEQLHITPKYLSSVVKNVSGKKASKWISEFVISEAQSLLVYSDLNVQQISNQLNFPTQSAFGKYFKSQTGVSPTDYLNINSADSN